MGETLRGLMQPGSLGIRTIFDRMRTIYQDGELVDAAGRTTYGEAAERILRLCTALRELGVGPGDRVGTFGFNTARHFELYYAVPLLGAVLHTINIRLHPDQIAYIVDHARDRVVFVDGELTEAFGEVAPRVSSPETFVRMGDGPDAGLDPLDHDTLVEKAQPATELPDVDEFAAFGLCYTSGTTGLPKGVLSSHRAIFLHSMATCMTDHIGISEHDRILPIVPLFHVFSWSLPYAAPFTGAELVFHGSDSSPEHLVDLIRRERVTQAAGVPTIWKGVLPLVRDDPPPDLRTLLVGGSAPPRVLIDDYDRIGIDLLQLWGMTETGPLACASRPRRHHRGLDREGLLDVRAKTGTIFSGLEARIVDPMGAELPWDGEQAGELEVRGPWIISDYYGDEGSSEKFHDGWLRTGDMAVIEPDGYMKIVDRAKDLVKSGGEWISSVELEGVILEHPEVADAAVVGVPSRKWDERPVAIVVPAPGAEPTLESIRAFLDGKVAKWWFPDEIVVTDEIPKTSVGKIDKKVIRSNLDDLVLP